MAFDSVRASGEGFDEGRNQAYTTNPIQFPEKSHSDLWGEIDTLTEEQLLSAEEGYRIGNLLNFADGFYESDFFQIGQGYGFEDGYSDGYEDAYNLLFDNYQKQRDIVADERQLDEPMKFMIDSFNHGYSYEYNKGYDMGVENAIDEDTGVKGAFEQYRGFKFGKEIGVLNAGWNPQYATSGDFLAENSLEQSYSHVYEVESADYWNGVLAGFSIGWDEYRANNPV